MSFDPCPNCSRSTEIAGELCTNCLDEIAEENDLVEKIMKSIQPTPTPKFCIDCIQFALAANEQDVPRCHLSQMVDIVTGGKFYPTCAEMRHPEAPCSQAAKYFQPKTPTTAPSVEPDKTNLN